MSETQKQKLSWKAMGATDIGGGRENQDDYFLWENPDRGLMVIGVLDGHGRDVGKVAAVVGCEYIRRYCEENQDMLENNTFDFLVTAIVQAHQAIKDAFVKTLETNGIEVKETVEGYLVKRKSDKSNWMCVHGGTSCSLVAIVGTNLFTANVGDSTAIMCTSQPVLKSGMVRFVGDAGDIDRKTSSLESNDDKLSNTLVITSDHSPESPFEFNRMRAFRTRDDDPKQPALLVVYDASQQDKTRCPAVFDLDSSNNPIVTNRGSYYKNVRREWASLVAAPPSAKFQDALAFTRSIGDFHLHLYGVCEFPEVHCVDLKAIVASLIAAGSFPTANAKAGGGGTAKQSPTPKKSSVSPLRLGGSPMRISPMVEKSENASSANAHDVDLKQFPEMCVVLASDGIWDNWEYEDVTSFVMNPSNATGSEDSGVSLAGQMSNALINANAVHARRNFGSQADNATGVVLYIHPNTLPI